MIRGLIGTGLAGLGIVGGVAAIHYSDNGSATVTVKNHGVTRTVKLRGAGGPTYSCPVGTVSKLRPVDILSGRIKLTIHDVERKLKPLKARYPGGTAPGAVVRYYNGLVRRDRRLVRAFNDSVAQHNRIIRTDCTKDR